MSTFEQYQTLCKDYLKPLLQHANQANHVFHIDQPSTDDPIDHCLTIQKELSQMRQSDIFQQIDNQTLTTLAEQTSLTIQSSLITMQRQMKFAHAQQDESADHTTWTIVTSGVENIGMQIYLMIHSILEQPTLDQQITKDEFQKLFKVMEPVLKDAREWVTFVVEPKK